MKNKAMELKKRIERIRKMADNAPSPFQGMSLEQAIKKMRKVREQLWEEKIALHTRH